MTQKFSGPHSSTPNPHPENAFHGQKARKVSTAARLMFLVPLPLLLSGIGEIFQGDVVGMALELGGFSLMMLSAWLLNEGLRAQEMFNARTIAKPPSIPRKMFAAVSIGLGVAAASFAGGLETGLIGSVAMGAMASAAQIVAFGLDPMRGKGIAGENSFEAERVANAVDKAEAYVADILDAAKRIKDKPLEARIERLAAKARDLFRSVEADPRDLSKARKFMTVYLMGARDATAKFADLYSRSRDAEARIKYEDLLGDLETSFTEHREQLLLTNQSDLEIEIEVLRDRLQREGVRTR